MLQGLRQTSAAALDLLQSRLALAGVELEEEAQRLGSLVVRALALLAFGLVGLVCLSLLVVLAVEPSQRLAILALITAGYLGAAVWLGLSIKRALRDRPPLLQATLAELAKDRDALLRASRAAPDADTP